MKSGGSSSGGSYVVAARVLLLVAAAAAAAVAMGIWLRGREPATGAGPRYACPMHPEVTAAGPGECPICRMALEPAGPNRPPSRRELAGMNDFIAVENIRKHNIVDFVRRRTPLFNGREMRGPAWVGDDGVVSAIFYKDQVAAMALDEAGTFSLTRDAGDVSAVRRADGPPAPWDDATAVVRFRFADKPPPTRTGRPPSPGAVGWLELARRPREVLAVPASAIVQSPEGPYVLVSIGGFEFEKRPIEIGETFTKQGFAVVLSGLRANERVVSRATFFIEANRRLGNHLVSTDDEGAVR